MLGPRPEVPVQTVKLDPIAYLLTGADQELPKVLEACAAR